MIIMRAIIIIAFLGAHAGICHGQLDTNYLYLDYLEIELEDSTEQLETIVFMNDTNTLVFTDVQKIKHLGISRRAACDLVVRTSKSDFKVYNINECLQEVGQTYYATIYLSKDHDPCVYATYYLSDLGQYFMEQTWRAYENDMMTDDCVNFFSFPSWAKDFQCSVFLE